MSELVRYWIDSDRRAANALESVDTALKAHMARRRDSRTSSSWDQPLELILRTARKEKSEAQRNYWHAILEEFGLAIGETKPRMKQIVKQEYYGLDERVMPNGRKVYTVQSSEDEDAEGYGRLIDFTLRLAAEQGIYIQDKRPRFASPE